MSSVIGSFATDHDCYRPGTAIWMVFEVKPPGVANFLFVSLFFKLTWETLKSAEDADDDFQHDFQPKSTGRKRIKINLSSA